MLKAAPRQVFRGLARRLQIQIRRWFHSYKGWTADAADMEENSSATSALSAVKNLCRLSEFFIVVSQLAGTFVYYGGAPGTDAPYLMVTRIVTVNTGGVRLGIPPAERKTRVTGEDFATGQRKERASSAAARVEKEAVAGAVLSLRRMGQHRQGRAAYRAGT